jgi:hypothetical protein
MHITLVIAALALPLQAADDPAMTVRALVRELDAPQKAARDEAERRLTELGPAALTALPALRSNDSAELSLRLNRVRLALLRQQAAQSLAASRVTLHVKNAKLAEVLADIEKQTGNKLIDYRRQFGQNAAEDDLLVSMTLDFDDVPFWRAVDELCAKYGYAIYPFAGEDGLALVRRTDADRLPSKVVYAGAFRLRLRRLTVTREPDAADADLQVDLEAAWEPRLRPLFLTVAAAKLRLTDDEGRTLSARNPQLVQEIPPQGRSTQVDVKFTAVAPPRSAQALRTFGGSFDVLLTAEMHTFRFADLSDRRRRAERAAAVTVTLEPTRMVNQLLEVPVRVHYENPVNALESHRAWFYKNPAYLETADGRKTPPGSTELARQSDDELLLNLMFVDPGDPAAQTFIYQTPADIVSLPIEFEFTDLPLP